jgi:catechol 2,3-dioxygenase-like lactoylglutathione lyase family enzyme
MRLGSQVVAVEKGPAAGHGRIDHLALAVPDLEAAARRILACGAMPDLAVTPQGPLTIPEFWGGGVRFLFLQGPGGARIELIQNLGRPAGPGHDHVGIPCTDIAASAAFVAGLGGRLVQSVALDRPEGRTEVRFLALGGSILELYQPPVAVARPGAGLWSRLLMPGVVPQTGPDGLQIGPG